MLSVRARLVTILKKDQIKFIGTDKKYFMDFSYPICFEREKFWKPTTDGCLVYSFGVDNKWVRCQKYVGNEFDHFRPNPASSMFYLVDE